MDIAERESWDSLQPHRHTCSPFKHAQLQYCHNVSVTERIIAGDIIISYDRWSPHLSCHTSAEVSLCNAWKSETTCARNVSGLPEQEWRPGFMNSFTESHLRGSCSGVTTSHRVPAWYVSAGTYARIITGCHGTLSPWQQHPPSSYQLYFWWWERGKKKKKNILWRNIKLPSGVLFSVCVVLSLCAVLTQGNDSLHCGLPWLQQKHAVSGPWPVASSSVLSLIQSYSYII